jgi:hypothetical protein
MRLPALRLDVKPPSMNRIYPLKRGERDDKT